MELFFLNKLFLVFLLIFPFILHLGKVEEPLNETSTWEHLFNVRLNSETNKINAFYEEKTNECEEGLRFAETEISSVCKSYYNKYACKPTKKNNLILSCAL